MLKTAFIEPAIVFLLLGAMSFAQQNSPQFVSLSPKKTKVDFENRVSENDTLNYFYFDNLYNGGGVAAGDINNDGLADLYFISNLGTDQLYLNMGNMKFKNITHKAFASQDNSGWHSAVSMADVNADGWLDIYVCRHGLGQSAHVNFPNLLYINNRDNTFTERAHEFGVDDSGRSIDADFVDVDQDGDLDLFVTNHRENTCIMDQFKHVPYQEQLHSNRLYRNDGDKFTEVTKASGVLSFGFCLAASTGDLNSDGWPDIYVTSDYGLPDFLFINQQNGRFKSEARDRLRHTSHYSMGVDIADFNNDLLADICVLDMSNKDYAKSKTNMGSMSVGTFWDNVAKGYNYQYMYNTLQLNLGSGYFSEIAHLSGIASTDWSWSPLLVDFDQDGLKDLFATNGYYRDVRDQDFTQVLKAYMATNPERFDCMKMLELIPQTREVNYAFRNQGDLTFEDVSTSWGFTVGSNSQGAAVADLDNDGDLDLVLNNLNEPAQIWENKLEQKRYLKIILKGPQNNPFAYGTKVIIHTDRGSQVQELNPSRGYASSSEPVLIFGLGDAEKVNSIEIIWDYRHQTTLPETEINSTIKVQYEEEKLEIATPLYGFKNPDRTFCKLTEKPFDDFEKEVLLPQKMSELGPFLSKGVITIPGKPKSRDVNCLFVGGSRDQAARIYLQSEGDKFEIFPQLAFEQDGAYEDAGSLFFDADNDGDQDLYVVSGGNEYEAYSEMYQDRFYRNTGNGVFVRDSAAVPIINSSGQRVIAADIDNDGDEDLAVLGRQVPGFYLLKPESYLLINENGKFVNQTQQLIPDLQFAGMITDGIFTDFDQDGDPDLMVVGEWMKPTLFENNGGKFAAADMITGCDELYGWWNCVVPLDINNDGKDEYLLGNTGLNNKFHPSVGFPFTARLDDVDKNGTYDLILSKYFGGVLHPVRGRGCLSDQVPSVKERFGTYDEFAHTPFDQLFSFTTSPEQVTEFANGILIREGDKLVFRKFDNFGQIGCINRFLPADLNQDRYMDFIAFGNKYETEIETPRYDANPGLAFVNQGGTGAFHVFPLEQNGPYVNRNAKDAVQIGSSIFVANSSESVDRLEINW